LAGLGDLGGCLICLLELEKSLKRLKFKGELSPLLRICQNGIWGSMGPYLHITLWIYRRAVGSTLTQRNTKCKPVTNFKGPWSYKNTTDRFLNLDSYKWYYTTMEISAVLNGKKYIMVCLKAPYWVIYSFNYTSMTCQSLYVTYLNQSYLLMTSALLY
jgi:hypothetical protein